MLLVACKPIADEVDTTDDVDQPDSVSDVLALFWNRAFDADRPDLDVAVQAMLDQLDEDALADDHAEGGQRRLTADDLGAVDLFAPEDDDGTWAMPDPDLARPVFIATRYTCDLDTLQGLLIARDQLALYDEAYETYARTYTTSDADFVAGTADALSWSVTLTSSYPGAGSFTEDLLGGIRRAPLPALEGVDPAADSYLVTRTWLPFPAARDNDAIAFDQDYQLEIYVPWGDGEIVHLYGIWRQLDTPFGDFEGDLVSRLTVNNLVRWDDQTETLCAEGAAD
ncbi:MAG: hypothetical protein H6733_05995 [Alphaproteobacteria bacterium]|nr:hypothetical protein [Alphaproteobacteria bacterium]